MKLLSDLDSFKICSISQFLRLCRTDYCLFWDCSLRYRNLPVDRPNCIYNEDFLGNVTSVKNSILSNPFEKFERKRFVYYSKDLKVLSFNPDLWEKMTEEYKGKIITKEKTLLDEYYRKYDASV